MADHYSHQDQTQININQILQQLKVRYNADQPYVNLGSHRLIVLNPHKPLDLLNDATLEIYGQHGYKNISYQQPQDEQRLEPHIYELATKVYFLLRRRNEDQAIMLRYVYIYIYIATLLLITYACGSTVVYRGLENLLHIITCSRSYFICRLIQKKTRGSETRSLEPIQY